MDPEAKGLQPGDRTSVRSWVGLAVEVAVEVAVQVQERMDGGGFGGGPGGICAESAIGRPVGGPSNCGSAHSRGFGS